MVIPLRYLSEFYRAISVRLVAIPGTISFLLASLVYMRDRLPYLSGLPSIKTVEELPIWGVVAIALAILAFWAIVGLTANAVQLRAQVEDLGAAWDRSGRDLISIREAIELIIANLSDQWGAGHDESELRRKAAGRIRQIGKENQVPIWGIELVDIDGEQLFQDHPMQVPPQAWHRLMVNCEAVFEKASTLDEPVLHTIEDPAFALMSDEPQQYGDLRVKAASIRAVFPKPR